MIYIKLKSISKKSSKQMTFFKNAFRNTENIKLTTSNRRADVIFIVDLKNGFIYSSIFKDITNIIFHKKLICYYEMERQPDLIPGIYACARKNNIYSSGSPFFFWLMDHAIPNYRELNRKYLFSFQGRNCNNLRSKILNINHNRAIIEDTTNSYTIFNLKKGNTKSNSNQRKIYFETLMKSKFTLAPKGTGNSSIRMYEAMAMKSVPVVLSDNLKLPENINWDSCSITSLKENDVPILVDFLEKNEKIYTTLSKNAFDSYQKLHNPIEFSNYIITQIYHLKKLKSRKKFLLLLAYEIFNEIVAITYNRIKIRIKLMILKLSFK